MYRKIKGEIFGLYWYNMYLVVSNQASMLQINSIKDLDQIIEAHERMMLATYFDLKAERSDFDECDVTGEVLTGDKIATVIIDGVPEPVEITNERY